MSQWTKELIIRSLSPTLDPSYPGSLRIYRKGEEPEIPAEALQAEEGMKEYLFAALISTRSVKKIM